MKKVLVLGGGFAGLQTAIELQKKKMFDVTLISDRDYLYLYPVSIWIPTREYSLSDAQVSLQGIADAFGFHVVTDSVTGINTKQNQVQCTNSNYQYDYLVIAVGADKMKHPGIEHTLSICGKPETSVAIQEQLDALISKGSGTIAVGFGGNPKDKSAVRGGPAFELLFNIHHLLKKKKIRDSFELIFFAPMPSPGERMGPRSLQLIDTMFEKMHIRKQFGKKISRFESGKIVLEDNSELSADLTLFIPASAGHSSLQNTDVPLTEAGFVKIDEHCLVERTTNVYAIGDTAALQGPEWKAKQGHIAELMGRCAAENIHNTEIGRDERKSYTSHINILCIMDTGNGAAFVFRNDKYAFAIPMPKLGHWLKKGWGAYAKLTKRGIIPRIPGL